MTQSALDPGLPEQPAEVSWPGRLPGWPAFIRELVGTLAARSQFVLQGDVRDLYLVPAPGRDTIAVRPPPEPRPSAIELTELLWRALRPSGYQCLIIYDPVHGLNVYPDNRVSRTVARNLFRRDITGSAPPLNEVRAYLAAVTGIQPPVLAGGPAPQPGPGDEADAPPGRRERPRVAFVIDYAARITRSPGNLEATERDFFLFCLKLAHAADRCGGGPPERPSRLFNPVVWLAGGERDLPDWLTAGSERIRSIIIPLPDLETRRHMAKLLAGDRGIVEPSDDDRRTINKFAEQTHGLTLFAMREIARMAAERQMPFDAIGDAIRIYKLGVTDDPWQRDSVKSRIAVGTAQITSADPDREDGDVRIRERVYGQDHAVTKTVDILKRAALGLSGAQASNPASRPRGVIFFAGPTGVGKTELAKAIAALLFGGADSFLRFDMSEFAAENSDHRLVGAPPGYIGFESGGELTSAVRAQPFRVVLFDEIEKANRRVFDKFLQILEDGRLTDGHGVTTYFSECILIFTSNLGVMSLEDQDELVRQVATVKRGDDFSDVEKGILWAIREYFTKKLRRPELLNRFGDNIVVFDFISDHAAEQIFDLQVANIGRQLVREQRLGLRLTGRARSELLRMCAANLDNGGRGIGNVLEAALINPLSRELFDRDYPPGSTVVVSAVTKIDSGYKLTLGDVGDRMLTA
jgi:hypothetical protein